MQKLEGQAMHCIQPQEISISQQTLNNESDCTKKRMKLFVFHKKQDMGCILQN